MAEPLYRKLGLEDTRCPNCGAHLALPQQERPKYHGRPFVWDGWPYLGLICLNACHLPPAMRRRFVKAMSELDFG